MGKLLEDSRQQIARGDKHKLKHDWWSGHGVEVERVKLDTGDYINADGTCNVVVDTKRSMVEIAQNINGEQHQRFKRECVRAQEAGMKLVVLVEDGRYKSVGDVRKWVNDHCTRCPVRRKTGCVPCDPRGKCARHGTMKPIQGDRLAKAMRTMTERYGVEFEFCAPEDAGERVCELCGVEFAEQLELGGGGL